MEPYALALGLTLAVEVPIVAAIAQRGCRPRAVLDGVLVNVVTHPLGWIAVRHVLVPWLPVELAIVVVEGTVYRRITGMTPRRAWAAALVANALSALGSFGSL